MILDYLSEKQQDAVLWKARRIMQDVKLTQPRKVAEAAAKIGELLLLLKDDALRITYIGQIAEECHIDQEVLLKQIDTIENKVKKEDKKKTDRQQAKVDEDYGYVTQRIPDDSLDEYYKYRFFERRNCEMTGLWFPRPDGNYERLTNFVLTPLFHLKSPEKNVRLVELYGYDPVRETNFTNLVELPSNELLKKDQFSCRVFDEGPYNVEPGFTNSHLSRLNKKISFHFRKAYELRNLGWQPEGFWAFANKAWKDTLYDYDQYGIVSIGERHYYSPSASTLASDQRDAEDLFDNDKKHSYSPAPITTAEWTRMISEVYGENGWALIGFAFLTVFLDIVKKCTQMPLFYPYGAVESGKSTLGESLGALFFQELKAFNLSTASTDYAFFNLVERYCNCPVQFNEFDEHAIKEEWFRFFKALFDDETRERGRGIKGKTHKQKVNTSIVIMGQYLSTKDDNSVLSRAIPCLVKRKEFSADEVKRFGKLKEYEKKGLTGLLVELLQYREYFKSNFYETLIEEEKTFRAKLVKAGKAFKNRTLKSYATMSAAIQVMEKKLTLPFSATQYQEYCLRRVAEISSIMAESNTLAEFWKIVEYLVDKEVIFDGSDYRIKVETSIKVLVGHDDKQTKAFEDPTKIIYLKLSSIHLEYTRAVGQTTKGKALNLQTLITYMKEQSYYVGVIQSVNFKMQDGSRKTTSAYALNYELLGVNLEHTRDDEDSRTQESIKVWVWEPVKPTTLADRFTFTVRRQIEVPGIDGMPPKTDTQWTTCFISRSDKAERELVKDAIIQLEGYTAINARGRRSMDVLQYTLEEIAGTEHTALTADEDKEGFLF